MLNPWKASKVSLTALLIFHLTSSWAEPYQSSQDLKTTATQFVLQHIVTEAGETVDVQAQLDATLKLAACLTPVEAALPPNGTWSQVNAVQMTCRDGLHNWHMFVPVNVHINADVVVAKHLVPINQVITENDIDFAKLDRNHLYSGYFKNKSDVIGQVATQTLNPGAVLTKSNLQTATLVHRNQPIDLVSQTQGIQVTMRGVAKTEGGVNNSIKVYNPSSKRTLDAVVVSSNKVEVVP